MASILIADNYLSIGLLYREVLEEQGHDVFVASSGKEAYLLALYKSIEIAVVDDKLPDFEAEEVFGKLKQLQPHIRGILTISSTFGTPENASLWDGIFIKTQDFTILEAQIKRLLQESSSAVSKPLHLEQEHQIAAKSTSANQPERLQTP